jgi:hypothetical protein
VRAALPGRVDQVFHALAVRAQILRRRRQGVDQYVAGRGDVASFAVCLVCRPFCCFATFVVAIAAAAAVVERERVAAHVSVEQALGALFGLQHVFQEVVVFPQIAGVELAAQDELGAVAHARARREAARLVRLAAGETAGEHAAAGALVLRLVQATHLAQPASRGGRGHRW